jgi:histone-lysine N-methyltransferase SETD3
MTGKPLQEQLNTLRTWVISQNGFLHPSVRIEASSNASRGSTLFLSPSAPALLSGTELVSCPWHLSLSHLNALNISPHFPARSSKWPDSFLRETAKEIIAVFFLAYQDVLGENSFWWPYIQALPREFDTPLWFTEHEMLYLHGTSLEKAKREREKLWTKEWEEGKARLKKVGWEDENLTWYSEWSISIT